MSAGTAPPEEEIPQSQKGFLGTIERIGNKIPHPAAPMLIAVAGSAALLTPIATPANLMVMTPGGYRFGD